VPSQEHSLLGGIYLNNYSHGGKYDLLSMYWHQNISRIVQLLDKLHEETVVFGILCNIDLIYININ